MTAAGATAPERASALWRQRGSVDGDGEEVVESGLMREGREEGQRAPCSSRCGQLPKQQVDGHGCAC